MISYSKRKIAESKLNLNPFPYFVVKNLIPNKELNKINKILPSFKIFQMKIYTIKAYQKQKKLFSQVQLIQKVK